MKKTFSITCEPEIMAQIDEYAKSLGMTRSTYLTWLGTTLARVCSSEEPLGNQMAFILTSLASNSSLTIKKE